MNDTDPRRPLRSFVLRQGRMTVGQQRAYDANWQRWGLEYGVGPLDYEAAFGRGGPRVLEIGFGMGQSLVAMAQAAPASNFVGIEVHRPGVGRLLHSMARYGVDNIRVYCHDAVEVLRDCIPAGSLDTVQIFFPDPWHKKRHHKRRLIQPAFARQLTDRLRPGGHLHLATDWEDYAAQMMAVLGAVDGLVNVAGAGQFSPRPAHRPLTRFELRGQRLGHGVRELVFIRD
ncbi:MAG: tRNA (guanosine(46)-N7)-methyltransferase TrmB [Halioglobus sp.]|nr:tRNA (guanosine(46)-N7)-methyltransferase TrmB [Halioglobus sp.]